MSKKKSEHANTPVCVCVRLAGHKFHAPAEFTKTPKVLAFKRTTNRFSLHKLIIKCSQMKDAKNGYMEPSSFLERQYNP